MNDDNLTNEREQHPERFKDRELEDGIKLALYRKCAEDEKYLIYFPTGMAKDVIDWFHINLMHPVESRLAETIRQTFYVRALDKLVKRHVTKCQICQESKVTAVQPVGKVPMWSERSSTPFDAVQVDCCGPWKIGVQCKRPKKTVTRKVHAVTIIDDAMAWPEVVQLEAKTAYHLAKKFDLQWLCRYPRPKMVIFDNGGEFIGKEFQELLCSYGIEQKPTTVLNQQSNGIKERMHLTMEDMLRTMTLTVPDELEETWRTELEAAMQAIAWALQTTVSAGVKYSPTNLAIGCDMILNQAVQVNWEEICNQRELKANRDNQRENTTRREYEYKEGQKCWIVKNRFERKKKLDKPAKGPFEIIQVYQNGTVKLNWNGYLETISIQRLKPCIE